MKKKLIWSAVIVIAIIAVIGYVNGTRMQKLKGAVSTASNTNFSGVVGVDSLKVGTGCGTNGGFAYCAGKVIDGDVLSTTTPASLTLQPTDLNYGVILMTPTVGSITVTLPATTTSGMSSFLPNVGDTKDILIVNATTTAAQNITIAGGTGTKLTNASTSAAIIGGGNQGIGSLKFVRKGNTDIGVQFVPSI